MRGEQCTHVWTLENTHIYVLERRTNENTKTLEENLNSTLVTKKNKTSFEEELLSSVNYYRMSIKQSKSFWKSYWIAG